MKLPTTTMAMTATMNTIGAAKMVTPTASWNSVQCGQQSKKPSASRLANKTARVDAVERLAKRRRYAASTSRVCCLLVVLALTGCGQSGPTSGDAVSETGPGIEDLYDCDEVRAVYVDAMNDLKYTDRETQDDYKYVARRAVQRMHELGCPRVPKAPRL